MNGLILSYIVSRANEEIRLAIARLQVEEGGRDVARDQGSIAGYKELIGNLAAVFHLEQAFLEDNGETAPQIPDLSDDELAIYCHEAEQIRNTEEWAELTRRFCENVEMMKTRLLLTADKVRDLDLIQASYRAQASYTSVFNTLESETARRARKAEEAAREPDLPFDAEESVDIEDPVDPEPRAVADSVLAFQR